MRLRCVLSWDILVVFVGLSIGFSPRLAGCRLLDARLRQCGRLDEQEGGQKILLHVTSQEKKGRQCAGSWWLQLERDQRQVVVWAKGRKFGEG
jgi:hypothetical protein